MEKNQKKKVAIALQGGGAHGSFAWGVLHRLLENENIEILGVSGTSAGAMNSAAVIQGLTKGGNKEAIKTLNDYWEAMAKVSKAASSPYAPTLFDKACKYHNLERSPSYFMMEYMQFFLSPYEFNPLNKNPFLDFISDFFDFEAVRNSNLGLYLATTEVQTGKIKIWDNKKFSPDVLMASACLPFLYQAVEIEGKYYWDGGYIANPAIYPLMDGCDTSDIVIVQLRRLKCDNVPKTRGEITDRLKEVTFNGCLVREMRAIYLITKLIDKGIIKEGTMRRYNTHIIRNEDSFDGLNMSSALNTDIEYLRMLHDEGYKTADKWLEENFENIGKKSTIDDDEVFEDFV